MKIQEIHRIFNVEGPRFHPRGPFSAPTIVYLRQLHAQLHGVTVPRMPLGWVPTPEFKTMDIPAPLLAKLDEDMYRTMEGTTSLLSGRSVTVRLSKPRRHGIARFRRDADIILFVLAFLDDLANPACSAVLQVNIVHTPFKKTIDSVVGEFDRHHVNSAYTYACSRDNQLVIFREEEWVKVLIHECFHALGFDFATLNQDAMNTQLRTLYRGLPPHIDFRAYEAYTETWAEFLNLALHRFIEHPRQGANAFIQQLRTAVFYEKAWTAFQCRKVLHHYRTSYDALVMGTSTTMYQEHHTQVFSYHVLKAVLFLHLDEFLVWCMTATKTPTLACLNFPKTAVPAFAQFVKDYYTSQCMDSWLDYVRLDRASPTARDSMRMTLGHADL
jgi:hypothetical protein